MAWIRSRARGGRAARREHDFQSAILDALEDGVVVTDPAGRVLDVSTTFCRLIGRERAELIGVAPPYPWWPAEQRDRYAAQLGDILAAAAGGQVDIVLERRDGSRLPVRVTRSWLRGPYGPIGHVATFEDIAERASAERSLRDAEERFRTVFDDAPIGMAITAVSGEVVRINRALEAILEYDSEQLAGMPTSAITHPDDLATDRKHRELMLSGGLTVDRRRKRFVLESGREVTAELTESVVRDAEGRPLHFVGQVRDVTAELAIQGAVEQAETELIASERRYRTLSTHAPVGIYETDHTGLPIWANERLRDIFGIGPDGPVAVIRDMLDPADHDRVIEAWTTAFAERRSFQLEYRIRRDDGRVVEVAGTATPLRDAAGDTTGFLGTVIDLTDRVEAERRRADSEARFRTVFESAPIGIALLTIDGRWLDVNPALERITGRTAAELMCLTFDDVTHPADRELGPSQIGELLRGESESVSFQKRYLRPDGTTIWVAISTAVVRSADGTPLHLVSQTEDVTARREHERKLRWDAEHDPLTGLANRRRLQEALATHLEATVGSTRRGAVLVLDLDGFKQVNDLLGHHCGDALLAGVGRILRRRLGEREVVARIGGDEFAVLLPAADERAAREVAEAIVRDVREGGSMLEGDGTPSVTASVGIALVEAGTGSAEQLLVAADLAMYDAKARGRNGIAVHRSNPPPFAQAS